MPVTVDLKASPKLYSNTWPAGADVIGVVRRDNGERGALVRIRRTGLLVQVNDGGTRSLPQRETETALAEAMADPQQARSLGGRLMGCKTSKAKAEASRANGRRGGRPKK
jgi:hypothetical protein